VPAVPPGDLLKLLPQAIDPANGNATSATRTTLMLPTAATAVPRT
jgi:hypothetical protein